MEIEQEQYDKLSNEDKNNFNHSLILIRLQIIPLEIMFIIFGTIFLVSFFSFKPILFFSFFIGSFVCFILIKIKSEKEYKRVCKKYFKIEVKNNGG